ncbi:hypothetical protein ABZ667_42545 [Streptomyces lavendulae]|uniref:hypothetical protein n=1 Tax=Streptomyces lavendulae TaxID=1914 RepID=UPI00340E03DF
MSQRLQAWMRRNRIRKLGIAGFAALFSLPMVSPFGKVGLAGANAACDRQLITSKVDFGTDSQATSGAVQENGEILIAGTADGHIALSRTSSNGTPDRSFGTRGSGTLSTDLGVESSAASVAVQSNGTTIIAGYIKNLEGATDFALARYDSRGRLDPTFGNNGKVTTDFNYGYDQANSIAVQPDGRIVAAGYSSWNDHTTFALARYDSRGRLDPTFGNNGKVTTDFEGLDAGANQMVIHPDGHITIAGYIKNLEGATDFALARYDSRGRLDPTFGNNGKVTTDFNYGYDQANSIAVQPDGRIVAAGYSSWNDHTTFALARYDSRGRLDPTFGNNGKVTTDLGGDYNQANGVAVQSDGRIVAAGYSSWNDHATFMIARYRVNGQLDKGFGVNGKSAVEFEGARQYGRGVIATPNGGFVAVGYADGATYSSFTLVRTPICHGRVSAKGD